jgi:RimJ/RimL family protein N-acetyltransferase
MNADPVVMEHFAAPLSREQSDEFADQIEARIDAEGYGLWAVERKDTARFIGFIGLLPAQFDAHFTPAVEVGWRLARDQWGNGYATEGARAAVDFGFEVVGLDEIVSFALPANTRSLAVMERIGMTHDPADDFDHPRFLDDDRMRRHVLYRIRRPGSPR